MRSHIKTISLFIMAMAVSACSEQAAVTERQLDTASVTRGEIRHVVGATGKIVPRDEVLVGAEVSGRVIELNVDFNSKVEAGQVLARIDPRSFQSRVDQLRNRIQSARADIDIQKASISRAEAQKGYASIQRDRMRDLITDDSVSRLDLENAERDYDVAIADIEIAKARLASAEANVQQLGAELEDALVNLDRTTIRSPIDGVVIERKVDQGQTVQASFSAPEMFIIAADLSEIQVEAIIVESDVAGLEEGDGVALTVDAYPDYRIDGIVERLRLKSSETNNIVTYIADISAKNPDGRLMPGMTANLQITIDIKSDVLRIPVTAERYRPSPEDLSEFEVAATGTEAEAGLLEPVYARLRSIGIEEDRLSEFKAMIEPASQEIRDTINDPTKSFMHTPMKITLTELTDNMLGGFLGPDERDAYAAQIALERTVRPVEVWLAAEGGKMRRSTIKLGLSDGSFVEVIDGLGPDQSVVTGVRQAGAGRPGRPA